MKLCLKAKSENANHRRIYSSLVNKLTFLKTKAPFRFVILP